MFQGNHPRLEQFCEHDLIDDQFATAPWLLALYIAAAEEQARGRSKRNGTVPNDLIKGNPCPRGTYILPACPSLKDDRGCWPNTAQSKTCPNGTR